MFQNDTPVFILFFRASSYGVLDHGFKTEGVQAVWALQFGNHLSAIYDNSWDLKITKAPLKLSYGIEKNCILSRLMTGVWFRNLVVYYHEDHLCAESHCSWTTIVKVLLCLFFEKHPVQNLPSFLYILPSNYLPSNLL